MIKPIEIHIGNYFAVPRKDQTPFRVDLMEYVTADLCKVGMNVHKYEFQGKLIDGHPLTWEHTDLEGIPLTEEWLLKLGFKPSLDTYLGYLSPSFRNSQRIRIRLSNTQNFYYSTNNSTNPLWITCVHQLQNLYFALSGKKLEVKS